ncbi:hypothetical protein EYF80_006805 [Liparis tanakae]|uniref:Uncharacterized protein n=1 Tax=Liparis tanakae TaxID=230148 RepID=A0A4Z2IZC2_9TELE|nr:hypothetical protein EYF80_006805 [Liparis tanakae]
MASRGHQGIGGVSTVRQWPGLQLSFGGVEASKGPWLWVSQRTYCYLPVHVALNACFLRPAPPPTTHPPYTRAPKAQWPAGHKEGGREKGKSAFVRAAETIYILQALPICSPTSVQPQ